MATIKIRWSVDELVNVMTQFDTQKVYRSTTGTGTYVEITTVSTRVALVAEQEDYLFDDTAGDNSYFYKTAYYNSTTTAEGTQSSAMSGETAQDPAISIITVAELKEFYLFGLDLTDDSGTEYPDSLYEHYIASAVSWLEHRLDIDILRKVYSDERHHFYRDDYYQFMWLKVRHYPMLTLDSVTMVFPSDVTVQEFSSDWLFPDLQNGQIQIVPGAGEQSRYLFLQSGRFLPGRIWGARLIPDVFRVAYTAGLDPVPDVIKDLVGKIASFGPLNIAGDLLGGAGIASQSLGIDGLSSTFNTTSSATNAGYGARILQYQKEIKEVVPTLRKYYKGIGITVV